MGEVNILELISQFEAHYVCHHTDFDMRMHSFRPLAVTAVMTVFREFVGGSSKCGAEDMVDHKLGDVHTVESTTTSRKQSIYSGFWQDRCTDRGAESGTPGQSPLGHEYIGEKKGGKKAKVDRGNLDSPGVPTEGCNVFDDVDFNLEEGNKSSEDEQQSVSAQALIQGSQTLSFMPSDSASECTMQSGLGGPMASQCIKHQLKKNFNLSDSQTQHLVEIQRLFLARLSSSRSLRPSPQIERVVYAQVVKKPAGQHDTQCADRLATHDAQCVDRLTTHDETQEPEGAQQ